MPSYNEVEGVPSHASVELLQKTGRERLGFRGAYFSDYFGIPNLVTQHHVAKDDDEAAILAMNAGVDADLPEGQVYARLPNLVRDGRVAESQVDAAVGRVLAMKFEAGLFEHPYVDARRAARATNTPADIKLARTVAQKSPDVLFGKVNPGGKLTVSIPRSVGELPAFYNQHPSSDLNIYVEGKRAPLFPFGHGLSYTTFDISAPRLAKPQMGVKGSVAVEVDVTNTGRRSGDEVVQLYVRDDVGSAPRPILELKGFQRVTLNPGERRTVRFELGPQSLAFWDINMNWVVEPGTFTVSVGNSSIALKSTSLTVVAAPGA